jgi:hypothetical protein
MTIGKRGYATHSDCDGANACDGAKACTSLKNVSIGWYVRWLFGMATHALFRVHRGVVGKKRAGQWWKEIARKINSTEGILQEQSLDEWNTVGMHILEEGESTWADVTRSPAAIALVKIIFDGAWQHLHQEPKCVYYECWHVTRTWNCCTVLPEYVENFLDVDPGQPLGHYLKTPKAVSFSKRCGFLFLFSTWVKLFFWPGQERGLFHQISS